jgi:hypothetical protein
LRQAEIVKDFLNLPQPKWDLVMKKVVTGPKCFEEFTTENGEADLSVSQQSHVFCSKLAVYLDHS